ncbi:oocyte zinc finger protein XlCOF6-like [Bacillus rossius redtenbacheri]|uniref:oocyte zinc finger protein XlCOF6-like n=1 Tax=Bacillus rossius redtenbacheri TaxID=93214 RepID=UPI002FDF0005
MESARLCRLCAARATALLPIFEGEGLKQQLSLKINKYLPVQVDRDDYLPDCVCHECSATLNAWHRLVEGCVVSDKKLRALFAARQKSAPVLVDEEASIKDIGVCCESEDENTEQQAETDGCAAIADSGTWHGIDRCNQASSLLSKFRINKNLNIKLNEPDADENSDSSLLPPEIADVKKECHIFKDYGDVCQVVSENKCFDTADEEFKGQTLTVLGSHYCDISLPKCGDAYEELSACDSKAASTEQLQRRSEPKFFECEVCCTEFSSQLELAAHTTANHMYVPPQCKYCSEVCEDDDQLEAHELLHQNNALNCPVCGKTLSTFRTLKQHFSVHANSGLRLCNFCNSVFSDQNELKKHEATHQNERPYLCDTCGKAFRYKGNMLSHCSTHLDDSIVRKFKCEFCGTVYRSKNILKRHLALHSNDGKNSFVCETCGKSFLTIQSLKVHVKVHSNSRPYECAVCNMSFKWKKNLRTHQRVHGAVEENHGEEESKRRIARVQCEICGKYFASKWNLSVHVKRHDVNFTGSSMCHICGKTLCDSQAMSRHLKVHAGIKPFKCAICGKSFGTKMSRDDHERTHTGEKPFCCDVCGKCFSSKPHLHVHRVVHSENRPFTCTYCPKSFRRRPHLVLHIRTHTGEKPYSCELCSRAFIQKNDMMKHMLTHSNERPFVCECGISFRQKRDLNKHKRKHAAVDVTFPPAITCM